MLRKCVFLFLAVALLLGGFMVPSKTALAARPEPPTAEGIQPPEIDFANLPDTIQKATQLQDSLTPDQQTAVRAILDKYLPEVAAVSESMAALGKPQRGEPVQMDMAIVERMNNITAGIEAEMAGVLSAEQLALFQAVTRPALPNAQMTPTPLGVEGYYTTNCFYGAYYNSYTWFYAYYGYLYNYYEYYYGAGASYAYYAYVYAYYGFQYSGYALNYVGNVYFTAYYTNMWLSSYPYNAYYYAYYANYYLDYAEYYAYLDYYYYGSGYDYAYYGWLYNYYAFYYSYYGYYYDYYCYYYLL